MKKILTLSILFSLMLAFTFCSKQQDDDKNDDKADQGTGNIPTDVVVDVPSAISSESASGKKSGIQDTITGGEVYGYTRTFIHVGEAAAEAVEGIMAAISTYNLNKAMTVKFTSENDGREKTLVVTEEVIFETATYEFKAQITDSDGSLGLEVFWNTNPVEGIAIAMPYNIDRTMNEAFAETMYRIDYSETGASGYEKDMTVSIDGNPMILSDIYGLDNLKMFVGLNGDIVDVFGNSNHPNAKFLTDSTGYGWAFVATGSQSNNVAKAKIALPPSDHPDNTDLFKDYLMKDVLKAQIYAEFGKTYDSALIDLFLPTYLANAEAPGYFNENGFVSAGANVPSVTGFSELHDMSNLTPYIPKEIKELVILFENE